MEGRDESGIIPVDLVQIPISIDKSSGVPAVVSVTTQRTGAGPWI